MAYGGMEMTGGAYTFVGAGALGQSLAAFLATAGCDVTLLGRPQRARSLAGAGRLSLAGVQPVNVPVAAGAGQPGVVGVVDDPRHIPPRSAVIFTVKGPDLALAAAEVRRHWPAAGEDVAWVAGLQNGVAKDDVLAGIFGRDRVVGAATVLGARRALDSAPVVVTGLGRTYFGEFDAEASSRVTAAHDAFGRAGLPCEVLPDIRGLLWAKCCNAAGAFAVSSLTRLASTTMMTREPLVLAYLAVVREAADVAVAEGVTLVDYPDLPIASYLRGRADEVAASIVSAVRAAAANATPSFSSMAQDVIAGRRTEVHEVFGDLTRRAVEHGLDVPLLRYTWQLVAGLQPGQ